MARKKGMTIELKIDCLKERRRGSRIKFGMPGKGRKTYFVDEMKQAKKDACRGKFSFEETHMKKLELNEEQIEMLHDCNVYDDLSKISCKDVHEYMIYNDGYTDGKCLIFFENHRGGPAHEQDKFIYYIGGEKEAELVARWVGVSVWTVGEKLWRFCDADDEDNLYDFESDGSEDEDEDNEE
jgi:hypothetical protein